MEQLGDLLPEPAQQGQPIREPDWGAFAVPVVGVALQGSVADPWEGAERAGVEVDEAVQEGELRPKRLPVRHTQKANRQARRGDIVPAPRSGGRSAWPR